MKRSIIILSMLAFLALQPRSIFGADRMDYKETDSQIYYIAPEIGIASNHTLPFNKTKIIELDESSCYTVGNRELISLSVLKSHLGMDIKLNENRTLDILSDGKYVATISIDENKYADDEKITTLSTQPILVNGLDLSVPFDFFDRILYTTIIRDGCGLVTIIYSDK